MFLPIPGVSQQDTSKALHRSAAKHGSDQCRAVSHLSVHSSYGIEQSFIICGLQTSQVHEHHSWGVCIVLQPFSENFLCL